MTSDPPSPRRSAASSLPDRPTALVTGGVRRVGLEIARALARDGCNLILTYNTSRGDARAAETDLAQLGARVETLQLDLDDLEGVDREFGALASRTPRLDILVHNAAAYAPTPLAEVTPEEVLRFYRVNAAAPLVLSKHAAPLLARSDLPGGGAIVGMADIHATGRPRPRFAPYAMSKAALAEMVRSLARELAPGVRVNGVAPGIVAWPEEGYESDEQAQDAYLSRVPLKRAGTPQDAAEVVRWLALDAHYITGEVIALDGGRRLA